MIPIDRLNINMQYWFICRNFKVFGRYKGMDKKIVKIDEAFIYFTSAAKKAFCIEQYYLLDSDVIVDIKVTESDA